MALPADYITGTITLTNASNAFTGTGTGWQAADFREGDVILGIQDNAGVVYVVASILDNTSGTLTQPWAGPTGTYTYRMRYEWDSSRVSAQTRTLIELLGNGNLIAFSGLTGPGMPVFDGPHSMVVKPESDFVRGVAFDVQVGTLAGRDAYDGQVAGFTVLVSDVGDGRSAVYSKLSNTSGDWSAPAYITGGVGPAGPYTEITVGPTTTLSPGSPATVTPVVVDADTIRLDFGLPRGADGSGTGDVVGPASAVDDRIAVFNGTTGKLIKDGGKTLSEIVPGAGSVTNTILANVPTNTLKGRVAAGVGSPQDLTATEALSILKTAGAYARDNILGTVGLSGGVPTGEIFDVGSNANGIYMKSTSGWMTCIQTVTINLNSNAFQSFTLPNVFVGTVGASIAFAVNPLTGASESWWANIGKVGVYAGTTNNTLVLYRETLVAVTGTAYITTNGKWAA